MWLLWRREEKTFKTIPTIHHQKQNFEGCEGSRLELWQREMVLKKKDNHAFLFSKQETASNPSCHPQDSVLKKISSNLVLCIREILPQNRKGNGNLANFSPALTHSLPRLMCLGVGDLQEATKNQNSSESF